MSDNKIIRGAAAIGVAQRSSGPSLWSDYQRGTHGWADRLPATPGLQTAATIPVGGDAGVSRHSAITNSLQSYANYKTWADRMRTSWEPDKGKVG